LGKLSRTKEKLVESEKRVSLQSKQMTFGHKAKQNSKSG